MLEVCEWFRMSVELAVLSNRLEASIVLHSCDDQGTDLGGGSDCDGDWNQYSRIAKGEGGESYTSSTVNHPGPVSKSMDLAVTTHLCYFNFRSRRAFPS